MKAFIRLRSLLALALVSGTAALLLAEPAWWVQRGVRDPAKAPSDFGALNQGQLKNLARAARDEMEAKLPGGAGAAINALVNSWSTPTATTSDFAVVNAGQLKAVAKPFYDRLISVRRVQSYPWTVGTTDDGDFSVANLGQAKAAFQFTLFEDLDGDGKDDNWERASYQNLHTFGTLDGDRDGISDGQEALEGTDSADATSNSRAILGLRLTSPLASAR